MQLPRFCNLFPPKRQWVEGVTRQGAEWTLAELTTKLDIPQPTVYSWLRKGRLEARRSRLPLVHSG
jgi:DNA-directed RNA polymerase specialized sigma24 family protein